MRIINSKGNTANTLCSCVCVHGRVRVENSRMQTLINIKKGRV